jgi:hypothetical protein
MRVVLVVIIVIVVIVFRLPLGGSKCELLIDIVLVVPTRCNLVFFSVIKFELLLDIVLYVPTRWGSFFKAILAKGLLPCVSSLSS